MKNFGCHGNHAYRFTRHGQSEYNVEDRIGGDSGLTPRGEEYVSIDVILVPGSSHRDILGVVRRNTFFTTHPYSVSMTTHIKVN